ncbi:37S ribosomal protein S7, mitochondrial [Tolypocladium capitatum]|uniref:Small ribosomal subunit protein uS7m n=1 Tax=Tolypocladium capitatum TaxID=45235 RepID=A0A2K3QJI1_9HYPO|nr:37S ribosomal protein S7, mitochondrial [Tolypocladium capitatum]
MSPRLRVWGACRALVVRTRSVPQPRIELFRQRIPGARHYSDDAPGHPPKPIDADAPSKTKAPLTSDKVDTAPAEVGRDSDGELAKDASSQVGETTQDSHINTLDDATLEQILYGGRPATSETKGGLTAAQEDALYREGTIPPPAEAEALLSKAQASGLSQPPVAVSNTIENPGHKFGLPRKPYPEGYNLKQRYHPVLEQITRLLMRDGKLSVAQRNMAMVMNFLRTAPAPIYSPKFPLLPGTPPSSHLPLNPILYITIAVDSVAPLLKVRNVPGAGGGGRALELPVPLGVRQRRRVAFQWILDVINKKPSKGSGRKQFPHRIAEEIIAVVEGRSSVWEKRRQVHKLGTAARANVNSKKLRVKKKK